MDIGVRIDSAFKPNRVGPKISPNLRVIVSVIRYSDTVFRPRKACFLPPLATLFSVKERIVMVPVLVVSSSDAAVEPTGDAG